MCPIPCTAHLLCNHYTENITRNPCPHRGYLGQSDIAYCPYPSLYIDEEKNNYCYQCQWRLQAEQHKAKTEAQKVEQAKKTERAKVEAARVEELSRAEEAEKLKVIKEAEEVQDIEFRRQLDEAVRPCRRQMADEEDEKLFWPERRTQYARDVRERVARHGRRSRSPEMKKSGRRSGVREGLLDVDG